MSQLVEAFRTSCLVAGARLGLTNGRLYRGDEFLLGDFLNSLSDGVAADEVAVRAIRHYCDDSGPRQVVFQFAVLAVCEFLNRNAGRPANPFPIQAATDLNKLMASQPTDESIRGWVTSHFG